MKIASSTPINSPVSAAAGQRMTAEKLYSGFTDTVQLGASGAAGTSIGYIAGIVVGNMAQNMGGNALYTLAAPAVGAAVGGLTGSAMYRDKNPHLANTAIVGGLASLGTLAGDAIGHGLTAVSGNGLYQAIGAAVGATNGASLALNLVSKDWGRANTAARFCTPTLAGASGGAALGCLTGALVSHLTGNPLYSTIAPILGGVAGSLGGLAVAVNYKPGPEKPQPSQRSYGGD